MLWSGCCCWGVTVDLWELEHQFGGWGGATTGPLFKWPDLCEGNLLWRGGLGVWRRGLRLVATRGATWTRAWTSGGPCIQDDSTSCREEKEWRGEQWAESLDLGGSCSSDVAFIPVCQTCRIIHVIITGSPCFLGQKKHSAAVQLLNVMWCNVARPLGSSEQLWEFAASLPHPERNVRNGALKRIKWALKILLVAQQQSRQASARSPGETRLIR